MLGWVILSALAAVALVGVGLRSLAIAGTRQGLWRPVVVGGPRGQVILGPRAHEISTIGDRAGTSRAVRVWIRNRSEVAQVVFVRTGWKYDTTRFLWPRGTRGQLDLRRVELAPDEAGDVILKALPNRLGHWPPQVSDPRQLPGCWLWLTVETQTGHKARRLIRTRLLGSACKALW